VFRIAFACCLCALPAIAAESLRDPTRPPMPEAIYAEPLIIEDELHLSFTRVGSNRKLAIINGRTCRRTGGKGCARIIAIRPGQVDLRNADGGARTLYLQSGGIKRPAGSTVHGKPQP